MGPKLYFWKLWRKYIKDIAKFEQIIVLEKGMVVGQGTHDELLKTCQLYTELWAMEQKLTGI